MFPAAPWTRNAEVRSCSSSIIRRDLHPGTSQTSTSSARSEARPPTLLLSPSSSPLFLLYSSSSSFAFLLSSLHPYTREGREAWRSVLLIFLSPSFFPFLPVFPLSPPFFFFIPQPFSLPPFLPSLPSSSFYSPFPFLLLFLLDIFSSFLAFLLPFACSFACPFPFLPPFSPSILSVAFVASVTGRGVLGDCLPGRGREGHQVLHSGETPVIGMNRADMGPLTVIYESSCTPWAWLSGSRGRKRGVGAGRGGDRGF